MIIGLPQGLLYFWFAPLWREYWQKVNCSVISSPPTDRQLMMTGVGSTLDEICLPIKIFIGHVKWLVPKVDKVMIPHLVKIEPKAFICPKFMGLPDIVRHTVPEIGEKMLVVKFDHPKTNFKQALDQAARQLGLKPPKKEFDLQNQLQGERIWPGLLNLNFQKMLNQQTENNLKIGVLGHPYCIYDPCFNLELLKRLRENDLTYYTPEMTPICYQGQGAGSLEKDLFWTLGRLQFDALEWMLEELNVDGFIHISTFACGPEAIVGELLEKRIRQANKPILKLNYEEHSGEAGVITRLEAFLDLMKYRCQVC